MKKAKWTNAVPKLAKQWAKDDRLWTTQETVQFNLELFARAVLASSRPFGNRLLLREALWEFVECEQKFGHNGQHEPSECVDCSRVIKGKAALSA